MADVFRFVLSTNRTLEVPGVGKFRLGVLDVPADDADAVSRARYRLDPYDVTEVGIVDADTPIPVLPENPGEPVASPGVHYFTNLDLLDPEGEVLDLLTAAWVELIENAETVTPNGVWDFSGATVTGLGDPVILSENITDATALGRALLAATDAAEVRTITGAGTSSLVLGSTSDTAKAGDYAPTKNDIGLGNVDNTSDVAKPVSVPQQSVFDTKADITAVDTKAPMSAVEGIKYHDFTTGGGTRPTGYARVRWVGGSARPTNMVAGDIWEHDS